MAVYSFDIVSDYDKAEMNNVFDQARREIENRYDFKGTTAELSWLNNEKTGIKIAGTSEWQIDAIIDILRKKLAVRHQSQKVLDLSLPVTVNNMQSSKSVPFRHGLDQDKSKKIISQIRIGFPKLKCLIQGDAIRVTGQSKDELQLVMQRLMKLDLDFPLVFTNYR